MTTPPLPEKTADRLLAAAEQVILREGGHAVSVRRIATLSGDNPALISYHFGGLEALLRQLLELNVNAICDSRAVQQEVALRERGKARRLRALVMAYMEPFWTTTARWHSDPARSVVREVMPMLDRSLLGAAVSRINTSVGESAMALASLLPHLSEDLLLVRLRLLASAADTMRARLSGTGLYPLRSVGWDRHDAILQEQLIQISLGALKAD